MSVQVLTNCKLYLDAFDLSGRTNKLGLTYGAKAEAATCFGQDTENFLPGLKVFKAAHEVLYEPGTGLIDETLFARVAVNDLLMSIGPLTGAESEVGFFGQVMGASYKPGFTLGGVPKGSFDGEASSTLIRGVIGANRTATSSSTGPIQTMAGPTATQSIYAGLHILAMSGTAGPTLAVTIQSATLIGFGSPTTRLTIPTQSAVGAVWATPVLGAVTDGFWRVNFTITGTNPSFTFVGLFGIQ